MDNNDFNYNDWKEQNLRPLEFWLSKLNENQKELLNEIRVRFNSELDSFSEMYREDIQIEIDLHVSNWAKKELLEKKHAEIVNGADMLRYYRNVLNEGNNMINEQFYNEFIMSFGVIGLVSNKPIEENEIKAIGYLQDVAMLNIIERMLDLVKEDIVFGHPRFKDIPIWQLVLSKLGNRFEYKTNKYPNVKFTIIKLFMNDNSLLNNVNDLTYIDFVKRRFKDEIKGKKFVKLAQHITRESENYIESLSELNRIYNSN